jgi:hypothetical protein
MNWSFFIAGCIGAIAPEIIRLYNVRNDSGVTFRAHYFLISVAYILLGGYVASIFPGLTGQFYAFCIGAGLVLVVNKMTEIAAALFEGTRRPLTPQAPNSESTGFKRRTPQESARQGTFLDFVHKL